MEAGCASETLVSTYKAAGCYNSEDHKLNVVDVTYITSSSRVLQEKLIVSHPVKNSTPSVKAEKGSLISLPEPATGLYSEEDKSSS
jgi:hypothetical protein